MKKILIFIAFATLLFCGCTTKTQEPEVLANDTIDVIVDSVDVDSTIIVVGD